MIEYEKFSLKSIRLYKGSSGIGGGGNGKKNKVLYTNADKTIIQSDEVITIRSGFRTDYEDLDGVLLAKATSNGNITLSVNRDFERVGGSSKWPIFEHRIKGAYILKEKGYGILGHTGINWDNVKSISGKTYGIGPLVKPLGFVWDGDNQRWIRK